MSKSKSKLQITCEKLRRKVALLSQQAQAERGAARKQITDLEAENHWLKGKLKRQTD